MASTSFFFKETFSNNPLPNISDSDNENQMDQEAMSHPQICGNKLAQIFVKNVYNYFVKNFPHISPLQETARALQISCKSVSKYKEGPKDELVGKTLRQKKKLKTADVGNGTKDQIRCEIYNMYNNSYTKKNRKYNYTLKTLKVCNRYS
ncbi:uncharacterized protein LOC115884140 [Sitophilus oryzae]|uniref:Uncharacterized protein LOC115884140 n=1 Tax=Sitophilus oryzae TaxID=7048 RepID=A0A6J2Y6A8_SITOR|nr:uncharacterized protein LOC115884140 [Sitophilus oryzae]